MHLGTAPNKSMAPGDAFPVEVVQASGPASQTLVTLQVRRGTTVGEALALSGLVDDPHACEAGVFGRRCAHSQLLRPYDRVEIYRPLEVDPKEARRRRAAKRRQQR